MSTSTLANSWVTVSEADGYMNTRIGADSWTAASTDLKTAALITAYYDITDSHTGLEGAVDVDLLKRCQLEQALFNIQFRTTADKRSALISQGVSSAGVVKEVYRSLEAGSVLCGAVLNLLKNYRNDGQMLGHTLLKYDPYATE